MTHKHVALAWRHDAAIHAHLEGAVLTLCGKPMVLSWGSELPLTCRGCKRAVARLIAAHPSTIREDSDTRE